MEKLQIVENELPEIKMWNGQRVVTFKDIDAVHCNKTGTARRNFNRNKKHFIEGEDYFFLTKKSNETDCPIKNNQMRQNDTLSFSIPSRGITLITESGYLLIAKSFTDDLSWDVQRRLVNSYFRQKEQAEKNTLPEVSKFPTQYMTSSTPLPKATDWYSRNLPRINRICFKANTNQKELFHHLLARLGAEYNLAEARKIYERELGRPPKYQLDVVGYFTELSQLADDFLEKLDKVEV